MSSSIYNSGGHSCLPKKSQSFTLGYEKYKGLCAEVLFFFFYHNCPFNIIVSHMPKTTKHFNTIGALFTKHSFDDHFLAYLLHESSSLRINLKTKFL